MANLPIKRMVLYKHGVGFFERYGSSGDSSTVSLTFKKDEMNDILKSLATFPQGDGQVVNVSYETPDDKHTALSKAPIVLSANAALLDLVRSLRGRLVRLHLPATNGTHEQDNLLAMGDDEVLVSGHLVGVDQVAAKPDHTLISLMTMGNESETVPALRTFPLSQIRGLDLLDAQSGDDLRYVLELSQARDDQRSVTIVLDRPQQELLVSYVAPTPTWRVSYRLVYQADTVSEGIDSAALASEQGQLLIQGWGIVDNQLDEDLEAVSLTLIAGQPISFVYDLYTPKFITRPTVQDEDRTMMGPIGFDGVLARAEAPRSVDSLADELFAELEMAPSNSIFTTLGPQPAARKRDLGQATKVEVKGTAKGEFFQYEVSIPVTIKRGQSAMVPILNATLAARKQHLFNVAKVPDHPVVALLAENTTGLTLERGPATVLEADNYVGEAVLAFTPIGNEFFVPYAVDLGVRIIPQEQSHEVTATITLGTGGYLVHDYYRIMTTTYAIENRNPTAFNLVIEQNRRSDYEVFETPEPSAQTAEFRRWTVLVAASVQTTFVVKERTHFARQERISDLSYRTLQDYLTGAFIDDRLFSQLKQILDRCQAVQRLERDLNQHTQALNRLTQLQKETSDKLQPLGRDGEEGQLRRRLVGKIQQLEDNCDRMTAIITGEQQQLERLKQQLEQDIQNVQSLP